MRLPKYVFTLLLLFKGLCPAIAQKTTLHNKAIDVTHYRFKIILNDTSNIIRGKATIHFVTKQKSSKVYFDLDKRNASTGKGMLVTKVTAGKNKLKFRQSSNRVYIYFKNPSEPGDQKIVTITYKGIPAKGLVIRKNQFGRRAFFADNWPNHAHYWIPCNDYLDDKATVEFIVIAPDHYEVIANGVKVEETGLPNGMKLTHWQMTNAISTDVMAIGVADFAVKLDTVVYHIPVTSWVFAKDKKKGFDQYSVTKGILPFFIHYIGPYPYKKLANVQSETRFGGMENATDIFYNEHSVSLHPKNQLAHKIEMTAIMAHETAHQWFGDAVTEINWANLWLSEGFATYFSSLYLKHKYGEKIFRQRLKHARKIVLAFYQKKKISVVDTADMNSPMVLLNRNSYQKGEWVLHMLHQKLGAITFRKGIRLYYATYRSGNASTQDFRRIMEKVSHQNLKLFFEQWLYTPGQPVLHGKWHYDKKKNILSVTINQMQDDLFKFPLQVGIQINGRTLIKNLNIHERYSTFDIHMASEPEKLILDPNINLLFKGTMVEY